MGAPPSSTSIRFVESVMELRSPPVLFPFCTTAGSLLTRVCTSAVSCATWFCCCCTACNRKRLSSRLKRLHWRHSTKLKQTRRRWQHPPRGFGDVSARRTWFEQCLVVSFTLMTTVVWLKHVGKLCVLYSECFVSTSSQTVPSNCFLVPRTCSSGQNLLEVLIVGVVSTAG